MEVKKYTGLPSLRKNCYDLWKAMKDGKTDDQYIVYTHVSHEDFLQIQQSVNSDTLQYIRWVYQFSTGTLKMKVIATLEHEVVSATIASMLAIQIEAMHLTEEIDALGTVHVKYGDFSKRADTS